MTETMVMHGQILPLEAVGVFRIGMGTCMVIVAESVCGCSVL